MLLCRLIMKAFVFETSTQYSWVKWQYWIVCKLIVVGCAAYDNFVNLLAVIVDE